MAIKKSRKFAEDPGAWPDNDAFQQAFQDAVGDVVGGAKIAQVVNFQTGAVATTSATIPDDDTIPQNTEGGEIMALAITPTNANSMLIIEVHAAIGVSTATWTVMALFQDSGADAIAAQRFHPGNDVLPLRHKMTAGTTSETTFKVRIGGTSGTLTLNGSIGGRKLGGVLASNITITEILP